MLTRLNNLNLTGQASRQSTTGLVLPSPEILELSAVEGGLGGGTAVVVTGLNFSEDMDPPTLGGIPVDNFQWNSETEIEFDTPAQPSAGLADLVAANPGSGPRTAANAFSYFFAEEFDDHYQPRFGQPDTLIHIEEFDDFT